MKRLEIAPSPWATLHKRDLLALKRYEGTKIITERDFLVLHRRLR